MTCIYSNIHTCSLHLQSFHGWKCWHVWTAVRDAEDWTCFPFFGIIVICAYLKEIANLTPYYSNPWRWCNECQTSLICIIMPNKIRIWLVVHRFYQVRLSYWAILPSQQVAWRDKVWLYIYIVSLTWQVRMIAEIWHCQANLSDNI